MSAHSSSNAEDASKEAEAGILPSHGISLDVPAVAEGDRPALIHPLSLPAYQSPLRHHRRGASVHREVKETLDARSEYTNNEEDGKAEHHINQYVIKDEIGRGSFGAVHLAVDQYGIEYAVKEFSKSRLRKRAQSNILRRPHSARRPGHLAAGGGFNSPMHRHSASDIHDAEEMGNPLYLIKEEIAIMKKLNHPNLVSLIEVLDDPEEDSLYMVLEMCKKGVVMKVGLNEKADPYDGESCRCWFRDLILGIEYLHAQGVVHRDIKPDNLLLDKDDVLKIVDFGVSEMFEKQSEMMTAKSAGSPAFLPPELCVTKHGDVSGKAADIWSMGVSLYCLRFGRIPFERSGVLELYEAIKNDEPVIDPDHEPEFADLMKKLLEKDPKKRITMSELREHPWVTKNGTDPLLSAEENTADLVEPPSDIEVKHAITAKMRNLVIMMTAVQKFKSLLDYKQPNALSAVLGKGIQSIQSSLGVPNPHLHKAHSGNFDDRSNVETILATEGIHHQINDSKPGLLASTSNQADKKTPSNSDTWSLDGARTPSAQNSSSPLPSAERQASSGEKGHAHDPMDEEPHFLGIGAGGDSLSPPLDEVVAESPTAAEFSIYDTAYQQEVERIRATQGEKATIYLTRRIDSKQDHKANENMFEAAGKEDDEGKSRPHEELKGVLDKVRGDGEEVEDAKTEVENSRFGNIAQLVIQNAKVAGEQAKTMGTKVVERKDAILESMER